MQILDNQCKIYTYFESMLETFNKIEILSDINYQQIWYQNKQRVK